MSSTQVSSCAPKPDFREWSHVYKAKRMRPTIGPRAYTLVTAGLHYLKGNQRPYFSVTAETWEHERARDIIEGGCMHETIARLWPSLVPVIAMHLSTDLGVPMHDAGNAWYFIAGTFHGCDDRYTLANAQGHHANADGSTSYRLPTPNEQIQTFADYVRVPFEQARQLQADWDVNDPPSSRRWLAQWIERQRPRWKQEADNAIALLDTLATEGANL